MSEEEKKVVVCVPDKPMYPHTDNSVKKKCDWCEQPVWVAPAVYEAAGTEDVQHLCAECFPRVFIETKEEITITPMTVAQHREFEKYLSQKKGVTITDPILACPDCRKITTDCKCKK